MKSRATSMAVAFAATLALWNADAQATAIQLQRSYDNPSPDANDLFGQSVSLSGGIALVGATLDSTTANGSGQAYLFNSATGALLRTLANPTPAVNDQFGLSVSLSGNLALVGAQFDDTGATNAGAAYLFNASTGALVRTFTNPGPTPILLDSFGHAVAVSGNRALISAPQDDAGATNAGAVYLFDTGTGALLRTFLNPSPAANDQFGSQVALRGNLALIGAFNKDSGAIADSGFVYLFDTNTGALLRTFSNPTPATNDDFGSSIALSATRVLIGAVQDDTRGFNEGAAYLYDLATGNLLNTLLIPLPRGTASFSAKASRCRTSSRWSARPSTTTPPPTPAAPISSTPIPVRCCSRSSIRSRSTPIGSASP